MSYATRTDWEDRFGHLSGGLPDGEIDTMLAEASAELNSEYLGRRDLAPKTVTGLRWPIMGPRRTARHLRVPDWPPLYPERWAFTLTALAFLDDLLVTQQTVTAVDVAANVAYGRGELVLPPGNWAQDGWWAQATYTCGYGTVATPNIPPELTLATLYLARHHLFEALGQADPEFGAAPIARSRAERLARPFAALPAAY